MSRAAPGGGSETTKPMAEPAGDGPVLSYPDLAMAKPIRETYGRICDPVLTVRQPGVAISEDAIALLGNPDAVCIGIAGRYVLIGVPGSIPQAVELVPRKPRSRRGEALWPIHNVALRRKLLDLGATPYTRIALVLHPKSDQLLLFGRIPDPRLHR